MRPVTPYFTAPTADRALAIGQVANPDSLEGIAMSPEAAVVGLAVVLGVSQSGTLQLRRVVLVVGSDISLPIVHFLDKSLSSSCTVALATAR